MKEMIISLFGEYVPVTYVDFIANADGTLTEVERVASGLAGVDWPWLLGALLFIIVFYSGFRILGVVFK